MKRPSILIVEDDPIVASDIKLKVRDFGFDVCGTAANGERAIELAHKHRPQAVLMDITLEGGMDGIAAAESIRSALHIPVVYLTAHSDQATVQRAKLTLPYGYALKPVREIELKIALEMALYTGQNTIPRTAERVPPPVEPVRGRETAVPTMEIVRLLSEEPLFKKVRRPLLEDVAVECYVQDYRMLEVISLEGDDDRNTDGFLVLSGRVAMLKTSLNGRELAVQLLGPESTFGLLSCLDSQLLNLTARAQTECRLLHVPKASLLYLLSEMPELYPELLAELSRRLRSLQDMARSLAHDRVEVRVAATLLMVLDHERSSGVKAKPGEIRMSRQELANISGTTVETAIRLTKNFEKLGILELPDHRVIRVLDAEQLREISAEGD